MPSNLVASRRTTTWTEDWVQYFKRLGIENFPRFVYDYYTFREPIVGSVRKHVPKGGSIIEFGCGSALLSILFSSMGYDVLGIDNHPRIVKMARFNNERLAGHAKIELMDIFEAPEKVPRIHPTPFSLSFCEGLIEHYGGAELKEAVRIHGELAKKTMMVVPTHEDSEVTTQDMYSFRELEDLCRSVGLTPIDRVSIGMGLLKWSRRLLPPALLRRLLALEFLACENIAVVCKSSIG